MEEEKKTNLMPAVIIEFIIIAVLLGLLAYVMLRENHVKCVDEPETKVEEKEPTPQEPIEEKKEDEEQPVEEAEPARSESSIENAFKEYYEEQGFAKASNILTWDIPKVEKVDNSKYQDMYLLEGTFSCKNKTDDCVYLEQVGEPRNGKYDFSLYVQVTENNGKYTFKIYGTNLD